MRATTACALTVVTAYVATMYVVSGFSRTQQPSSPPPPPQPPTFRTEANYVRVDVYPTKDGAPVPDLARDDFEILESGQPQRIEQFERIVVRAAGPQESRVEPNTVAQSRSMAETTRGRIFVVFLDTAHVSVDGSHRIRRPLIEALDRLIGSDDLVAMMTPEMSASDIAFARKTTTIEGLLTRYWPWGERDQLNSRDPIEDQYRFCFPPVAPSPVCPDDSRGVADEMIARRREKITLDALEDLVRYLRGVREERKAIIGVSDGWLLFTPNAHLARRLECKTPGLPPVTVDPRSGRPTTKPFSPDRGPSPEICERDRQTLAYADDAQAFRLLLDEANRANASFYPIDPRGLPVFDTPINAAAPPAADLAMLRQRETSLRTLAEATDGLAMVNSNDLSGSFRKIVADLSSYYLLGYYSNGKLDGKFHPISVRVKRPGVQVRARRGYLAATPAEAARTARDAGATAPSPAETEALAIEAVLRPLTAFTRETSLRLRAAAAWKADGKPLVWLVGEVGTADTWKAGAEADVVLTQEGQTLASARATVPPGTRTFKVALAPDAALTAGSYTISVRTRALSMMATSSDTVPLPIPAAPASIGSVLVRRGPFTGLKEVPTADLRFRRSEQLRVEIPAALRLRSGQAGPGSDDAPTARLLDRTGKPMTGIPLAAVVRDDGDGIRWHTVQVPLVPLAPGDYIVEIAAGSVKTLTPFRVVP